VGEDRVCDIAAGANDSVVVDVYRLQQVRQPTRNGCNATPPCPCLRTNISRVFSAVHGCTSGKSSRLRTRQRYVESRFRARQRSSSDKTSVVLSFSVATLSHHFGVGRLECRYGELAVLFSPRLWMLEEIAQQVYYLVAAVGFEQPRKKFTLSSVNVRLGAEPGYETAIVRSHRLCEPF